MPSRLQRSVSSHTNQNDPYITQPSQKGKMGHGFQGMNVLVHAEVHSATRARRIVNVCCRQLTQAQIRFINVIVNGAIAWSVVRSPRCGVVMPLLPTLDDRTESPCGPGFLAPIPTAVHNFSRTKGLDDWLQKAMSLAQTAFAPVERLEAEVHQDRETEDEWIVLRVVVSADRVNVPVARKRYTAEWVASVPSPQRFLIRLSPDVL